MDHYVNQPNIKALREALAAVLVRLQLAMTRREPSSVPCADMLAEVAWHLERMSKEVQQLESIIHGTLAPVVGVAGQAEDAYGACEALMTWIDNWTERMHEVQRLYPQPHERDARDWLAGAYRHLLRDVATGLAALMRLLEDPRGEMMRRGLPTEGHVKLPLVITLSPAPEMEALAGWARQRGRGPRRQSPSGYRGLGFLDWVGAIALGVWAGSALGDED